MVLVLDLKRQGLNKNWDKYSFTHQESIEVFELMPGSIWTNKERLNKVCSLLPDVDVLFIFALRPVELLILSLLRKRTRVILIQHGIFVPLMKRDIGGIFRKSKEVILYLISLWRLGAVNLETLAWVMGRREFAQTSLYEISSRVDDIIVYSEYWKNYFKENFGTEGNFRYVGNPDSLLYSGKTKVVDGIVYVAQTLIEDARLSMSDWNNFIRQLNDYMLKNDISQIHIKLHPRTDRKIFNNIDHSITKLYYLEELPISRTILGHYSTLLGLYWSKGCEVLIYEFEGHKTPEFMPSNRTKDLLSFFHTYNSNPVDYYYGNDQSSYAEVIQDILNGYTRS